MAMRRLEGGAGGVGQLGTVSVLVVVAFVAALGLVLFGDMPGEPAPEVTAQPTPSPSSVSTFYTQARVTGEPVVDLTIFAQA